MQINSNFKEFENLSVEKKTQSKASFFHRNTLKDIFSKLIKQSNLIHRNIKTNFHG